MWMPLPPQAAAPGGHPVNYGMISWIAKFLGFILLFIGTLIVILGVEPSGNCFTSTACANTGWVGGAANYLVAGKLLWAIGLFFLGCGAGLKLHFKLGWTQGMNAEEVRFVTWDRAANYAIIIVAIWFLYAILAAIPLITSTAGL